MRKGLENIKWHIIGWGFLILYELWVLVLKGGIADSFWKVVLYYIVNISLFYSNFFCLRHTEGTPGRIPRLLLCIVIELTIYTWFILVINKNGELATLDLNWVTGHLKSVELTTARGIYFLILSLGAWKSYEAYNRQKENVLLVRERFRSEKEHLKLANDKLQLQRELARSEVQYLKAQVTPHFIYNTLNYLYNGLEGQDDNRAEALLLLSDILRYNLTDIPKSGKVPVSAEIKNIEDLVALSKLRFDGKCYIEIHISGQASTVQIIPMVLGTLVENIFKHGDITDAGSPACIELKVSGRSLVFHTRNKIKRSVTKDDRPHTGLSFAEKRLESAYKDHFSLVSRSEKSIFETELKIDAL